MGVLPKKAFDVLFLGSDAFSLGSLNALLRRRGAALAGRPLSRARNLAGQAADAAVALARTDLWNSLQIVTPASKAIGHKKQETYECEAAPCSALGPGARSQVRLR